MAAQIMDPGTSDLFWKSRAKISQNLDKQLDPCAFYNSDAIDYFRQKVLIWIEDKN